MAHVNVFPNVKQSGSLETWGGCVWGAGEVFAPSSFGVFGLSHSQPREFVLTGVLRVSTATGIQGARACHPRDCHCSVE